MHTPTHTPAASHEAILERPVLATWPPIATHHWARLCRCGNDRHGLTRLQGHANKTIGKHRYDDVTDDNDGDNRMARRPKRTGDEADDESDNKSDSETDGVFDEDGSRGHAFSAHASPQQKLLVCSIESATPSSTFRNMSMRFPLPNKNSPTGCCQMWESSQNESAPDQTAKSQSNRRN